MALPSYSFFLFTVLIPFAFAKQSLPLPRFASLKSSQVNVRVGPGPEYPIEWVFKKAHLPVQIVAEYETWRQIKDLEGTTGWVHQNMLSGKRYVMVKTSGSKLLSSDHREARPLAKVSSGLIGLLKKCKSGFCQVQFDQHKGWIEMNDLWGAEPKDCQ